MWRPDSLPTALLSTVLFGLAGIALTLIGFKLFDWITPGIKLETELAQNRNIAVAIVVAALILGISILLAAVVSA